jgi:phosphoglucomutase
MDKSVILKKANAYVASEKNEKFRVEVEELLKTEDMDELSERFYKDLEFGTGGLRGIIGGGYNRLNSYTIQKATQGLATYINSQNIENPSVAIAFDSRNFSDLFAEEAAKVLAANGITAHLFDSLRPVPVLSFAVRELKTTAGIVVTASHNPAQYNGYKVYWSDGCQVTEPHDTLIVECANSVSEIKSIDKNEAIKNGSIKMIDESIDIKYRDMVKGLALRPELLKKSGSEVKVVYTPLHGSGKVPVSEALSEMGIDVVWVDEQKEPNGDFPTVKKPNPEEAEALTMAINLAKKEQADLILATDPDADRLGIAVPNSDGEFVLISGNQLGALLADYVLSGKKEQGTMPNNPAFVKTIVTTNLQRKIAESFGVTSFDVLTGFKFIGSKIREWEESGEYNYTLGGEESYGYLVGTAVRDKDAVSAATLTAEMALYHRSEGRTLLEQLENIWREHGYFQESLINIDFEGQSGAAKIVAIMENLRKESPKKIGSIAVNEIFDYNTSKVTDVNGKGIRTIDLPTSNVLQFVLEDETVVTARPSGTEPKIKFYVSAFANESNLDTAKTVVADKVEMLTVAIRNLIN